LKKINPTIILVRPQLSENIGMAARAMDNFGLSKLFSVNPRDGWPSKQADTSAKHADKIINKAKVILSKIAL
jgi:tRNA/rRNA methyltransferase